MRAAVIAFVVVLALLVMTGIATELTASDPEHVRPESLERPNGGRTDGTSEQFIALGVWGESFDRFVEGVQREEREREERRLAEEAEAERLARARAAANVTVARPGTSAPSAVGSSNCDDLPAWFPRWIAWRESNCTRGINTGNGYYGFAQVAGFHWFGGICNGLTWTIPAQEDECVDRLSAHGTNLKPWGG